MREIVGELADEGPTEAEVERARSYAAGRRVLAFESTIAVARAAVEEGVVFRSTVDPDELIAALDRVTYDDVCRWLERWPASRRSPASVLTSWATSRSLQSR